MPTQTKPLLPSSKPTDAIVNLSHLKLFHHFQTCTQQTLLFPSEFWGQSLQLCFQFEFLMNAMLCVAARHLAFLQPDDTTYATAAANHLSRALSLFHQVLSNFNSIHLDAFIATSVLLQYEVWTSTDFCSLQDGRVVSFDPAKDRIFALSSGMKEVFLKSVPLISSQPSVLLTHLAHNPRNVLVEAAQISNDTVVRYQAFFSYDRPLDLEQLKVPLPFRRDTGLAFWTRWEDVHKISKESNSRDMGYEDIISELCLILSFLPEARPVESGSIKTPLLPELVRFIFTFPVMCRGPFTSMFQQSDPHAFLLLYHFYRAVRILLPSDKCWWARERATLSETLLREWLVRESGGVPSETTRPVRVT
jgi:hypothetical protein